MYVRQPELLGHVNGCESELAVLGLNDEGQVVSGVVDLVAYRVNSALLVDHKSDGVIDDYRYWAQLIAYGRLSGESAQVALNWLTQAAFSKIPISEGFR